MQNAKQKRLILIDDDQTFGHIMLRCAEEMGLELDYFESLEDLGFVGLMADYDVAILDYDLGKMTGLEIGEYLTAFFGKMPMLLISGTMRDLGPAEGNRGIPGPFLHKASGPAQILSAAMQLKAAGKPTEKQAEAANVEAVLP